MILVSASASTLADGKVSFDTELLASRLDPVADTDHRSLSALARIAP